MSNSTEDYPDIFAASEDNIIVIDPHFNAYQPSKEHNGVVFVEKCLVRKGKYVRTELSDPDTGALERKPSGDIDAFLVKETNFTDIGGGLQTFERHYATIPSVWYEYEEVTYSTSYTGKINYRLKSGTGAAWSRSRSVLAKATHYYNRKSLVPNDRFPDTRTAGTDFVNDFTKFFNIAPQSSLGRNWENYTVPEFPVFETVIAADKIIPYMGEIYEFIRYTIEF